MLAKILFTLGAVFATASVHAHGSHGQKCCCAKHSSPVQTTTPEEQPAPPMKKQTHTDDLSVADSLHDTNAPSDEDIAI